MNTKPERNEIMTYRRLENIMSRLQNGQSIKQDLSEEETRSKIRDVQQVLGRKVTLQSPKGNFQGIFTLAKNGFGVNFLYNNKGRVNVRIYSPEDLCLQSAQDYAFTTEEEIDCVFPLYGLENLIAKARIYVAELRR